MRISRLLTLLTASLLLVSVQPAHAQAPAAAPAVTPTHRVAVQRLIVVSRVRELSEQSTETMMATQLQQMPQLGPVAGVLREFYHEQLSWTVLEPEFMRLYLEVFSEAEVHDLIRFYESPAGQTLLTKTPVLMAKSQEVSSRRLQAAMPQLMQRLQAALEGGTRPPTDTTRAAKP
jgi:hypothetical protein